VLDRVVDEQDGLLEEETGDLAEISNLNDLMHMREKEHA
jgi:hypothetical protein